MIAPIYVDDWKTVKERWLAYWDCDFIDRPILQISVPKKDAVWNDKEIEAENNIPEKRHGDIEHIHKMGVYRLERTKFLAEGMPVLHSCSSVGQALYYGCEIIYDITSAWAKPLPFTDGELPDFAIDKNNYWYKWHRDCLRFLAQNCGGRYFMLPTFGNHAGDTLSLVRGTENLMADIIENPEWVRETDFRIGIELTDAINERFLDVEASGMDGYANDAGMWSPKRPWDIHCDVSYMVSTDVFKNIFWPSQKYVVDQSDGYNYYHVDGKGVLNHIDVILKEPNIQAIQWVAGGYGYLNLMEHIDIYKKIQANGKSFHATAHYEHILPFLKSKEIRPGGACFNVLGCPDEDAACKLIEDVTKFYKS